MTREEAIKQLESLYDYCENMRSSDNAFAVWERDCKAIKIALSALRPISREQVEKVWRGEWEDMREAYNDVPQRSCSRCKSVFIGLDTPFCEVCGAPMTDKAVEILVKRMEEMRNG